MSALGEILRRYRFHGVPGAPAAVGVPADRTGERSVELNPVFGALEDIQRQASDLEALARRDAARRRADAVEQGRRVVAEARAAADSARAAAAAELIARADDERSRLLAAARLEADRIGRVAAVRTPVLVDEAVRRALSVGALPR
jgi:hypothetical protein